MTIPAPLLDRIKKGRAVLFLGSGALYGAKLTKNKKIPLGNDLRDILCDEFLSGDFKHEQLSHVSAMAISAYSLVSVQTFIADYFSDISPAEYHYQIPRYRWRAIFTTNYDRLIEETYRNANEKLQKLVAISSDVQYEENSEIPECSLSFIKLHGCVTRTSDENLPLILTTEQYNEYRNNREGLFKNLYELAYQDTIIFVGHSLQDANIRDILSELEKEAPNGERHYLLKPGLKSIERDFWAQKKISALDLTFEDFFKHLGEQIEENQRILISATSNNSHPIKVYFNSHSNPSNELIASLDVDMVFLEKSMAVNTCNAEDFFKGVDLQWSPIVEKVAIERTIQSRIFKTVLRKTNADRDLHTEFFVVKGEAGSGKTVLLRQLAWQTMSEKLGIVLWIRATKSLDIYLIEELCHKSGERVFIFWDNASNNSVEMNDFITKAVKKGLKITLMTAERYNEWNVRCKDLDELLTDKFKMSYLSEDEIQLLVASLEKHDSLGPNLKHKTHEQRCEAFKEAYGRQLLVALHEATLGETFEDIIYNEYNRISPDIAKNIYLTVSVLNRLRVPIRAGLISRIHEITFDKFQQELYQPLEKVVLTSGEHNHDVYYVTRHSEIAEIVFRRVLKRADDRYSEYIKILSKLNISYSSDRESYRLLIKAKSLKELFPDHADVDAIYKVAYTVFGDDPYLLQQMGNYERLRLNGNMDKAIELFEKAQTLAPRDSSILHSLSTWWRDKAEIADDKDLRIKARNESRGYLQQVVNKWGENSYVSAALVDLSIRDLSDSLRDEDSPPNLINDAIRRVQRELSDNKKKYPSDGHVYKLEAKFSELINDSDRALKSLEKAFEETDRDPFLAIRLASIYVDSDRIDDAKRILFSAIERRRSDHNLFFHYAELLRNHTNSDHDDLAHYYRNAFTPDDRNYLAQFWCARFSYFSTEFKKHESAVDAFNNIRKGRISFEARNKLRDYDGGFKTPHIHNGVLEKKREGFGFIVIDGKGYELFVPASQVLENLWDALDEGDRLSFNIGFSFGGPLATNVKPI